MCCKNKLLLDQGVQDVVHLNMSTKYESLEEIPNFMTTNALDLVALIPFN